MKRPYPCIYCTEDGHCKEFSDKEVTAWCVLGPCQYAKPSNGDRIRSMSDDELAEEMSVRLSEDCLMCPVLQADCPVWDETKNVECKDAMLDWLKQEVDDG